MKAHHFFTEDNVALELTFKKLFLKLWPFLWKQKRKVFVSAFLVLFYAGVGRLPPFLFGYAIDHGIKTHDHRVIYLIALAYLAIELVRAGLSFKQDKYIQTFGNSVLFEIRERLIAHVQSLPVKYFEKNPSGRIVTRVTNDVFALGELFNQGFTAIFVSVIEMATIFISLALVSLTMTAAVVVVLPPLLWICTRLSRRIRVQFGAAKRKLSMINAFSAESMSGMKVLQLFNRTAESRAFFDQVSGEYRDLQISTIKLFATLWPVLEAFNVSSLAVALFLGAYLHKYAGLSLGSLSAYILLLQSFFKPLKTILERYNQLQNSLASADRVFHLLNETNEKSNGAAFPVGPLRGHIEFRNVNFRYSEDGPLVLKDVNLTITPGTSVALVGRTGSGKSTMISLLQKFYDVEDGDILIDGLSLQQISPASLRPRVGVIQQDGFVFSGNLASNITLFDSSVPMERVTRALELAQCQEILRQHGGLNGRVHERGSNLSAGERQLLAFARVLAFDPDILILDEATSNIDSISESRIQSATEIATQGRTSVIIAHRLSTILNCDLIVVLDEGRIVETGRHEELLARKGKYHELYTLQFSRKAKTAAEVGSHSSIL